MIPYLVGDFISKLIEGNILKNLHNELNSFQFSVIFKLPHLQEEDFQPEVELEVVHWLEGKLEEEEEEEEEDQEEGVLD